MTRFDSLDSALSLSHDRLAACGTATECWSEMRALYDSCDIPHVTYGAMFAPHFRTNLDVEVLYQTHFAADFMSNYAEHGLIRHDVAVHWAFFHDTPRCWQSLRTEGVMSPEQKRVWVEGAAYGVRNGLSVPLRFGREANPGGLFLSATGMSDRAWSLLFREKAPLLIGIAHGFHLAMTRFPLFGEPLGPVDRVVSLTRRERECLLWASRGCHTGEIADRLDLADRTVEHHMASARRKLQARTTAQAVARAMAMGQLYDQG